MSRRRRPNSRIRKTPHEIVLEFIRPVSDDKGDFEKTRAYRPTIRDLRETIRDYLQEAKVGRRNASRFYIYLDSIKFLEFDSNNPSHACGYWEFKVSGPGYLVGAILFEGGD